MPRSIEDNVSVYFDRAAAFSSHPKGLLEQIRACNGVYAFQFPVRHPDGRIEVVRAWRAEHSHHKLPTKNLSHVRFGRLERRHQAASDLRLLHAIEQATGKTFTDAERAALVHAPDELSIVNSGLEETMVTAYQEIRDTRQRQPAVQDLRTAAFVNAINKVARAYLELGIFP